MVGIDLSRPGMPGGHIRSDKGLYVSNGAGGGAGGLSQVVSAQVQNNGSSSSDTLTFAVPADLQNDDYAVLITMKSDDAQPTYPGESFTQLDNQVGAGGSPDRGLSLAYKRITDAATEISGSPWTFTSATQKQHIGFLWILRGVNTSTPLDVHGLGNTSAAINPMTSQVLTTTGSNRIGIWFWGGARVGSGTHNILAAPAGEGFENFIAGADSEGNDICFGGAAAVLIPSAVTTSFGTVTMTASNSFVTMLGAITLILD